MSILAQNEAVGLDADKLGELYRQLGDVSAEDVLCRALEELAFKLARFERCFREGRRAEMHKAARLIAAIADQIGMQLLARVACDVIRCADHGDTVALAAVVARLIRTGERSLTEIWDMQDLPF